MKVSIRHKNGANDNFERLIQSIDVARQSFKDECEVMREFAATPMTTAQFNEFVDEVYSVKEDDVFRKREQLTAAWFGGLGAEFAPQSLWAGVNAITQVETSTKNLSARSQIKKFQRANFGNGMTISQKTMELAAQLV